MAALLLTAEDSHAVPSVTIETVTALEDLAALRADYERLGRITGNGVPFALHDWHVTWCQYFLNCDPRIQEELLFFVLRNAQHACVAVLPFILSRRRLGPLRVASVNLLGADPAITEIRAPMVEPGYEYLTARAAQCALEKIPDWDWVHWAQVGPALASALSASGRALHWQPSVSDFVIDLEPSWEEFRAGLKRNIRESLRHGYNSLKRDGLRFEFEVIEKPADMRRGLDQYLRLHRMRADLACDVRHPDRFASKVSRDFLYTLCDRLAARGCVRLFALRVQGQYAAMRLAFAVGDSLYLYYSGFDPRWWRYGVMTTTVAEAIKYAIRTGFKTVNLSPTKDVSKTRWGPRQVDYASAYQTGPRLRSRLANRAYRTARPDGHQPSRFLQRLITLRSWN